MLPFLSRDISRREFNALGGLSLTAAALLRSAGMARAFPNRPNAEVIPWLDPPDPNPVPDAVRTLLEWEDLDSWITPNDEFFSIHHFPDVEVDPGAYRLGVEGLVDNPMSLTLEDIRARPRQEVVFTIECSGNHGFPFNIGTIGNARWAGTPLATVLEEAGVADDAIEVVFWGADSGEVELHDDIRDVVMVQNFARSMSLADAMSPDNLLCYEMNGVDLPGRNGAPLRLIAPGWYGVANVKWLTRIELRDRRFMNLFMGRNYVTIREEVRDGETVWTETSVGRSRLKSAPAKVTRVGDDYRVIGAAWGAPVARVEVSIDGGEWREATIDTTEEAEFAWKIWSLDWPDAAPGEHSVTSRAISESGDIQPAADDPWITGKHTYWESNQQITRRVDLA